MSLYQLFFLIVVGMLTFVGGCVAAVLYGRFDIATFLMLVCILIKLTFMDDKP